ncbi:hypothetical protein KSF_005700 [Reticulibacter mediterranei]|uniref:Uncharacterized protein n=1 Tax=Reticulibacter mediterranei TaxID=2778369 RepID=A0A8J3IF89_9CHLR|nr:hypothetical protein KSF_005700 [Reticulibacter mediterranei]
MQHGTFSFEGLQAFAQQKNDFREKIERLGAARAEYSTYGGTHVRINSFF